VSDDKRLWTVEVEYSLIVHAETKEKAERIARRHTRDEEPVRTWAQRTRSYEAEDWSDCLPWGGEGERTVGELYEEE
jgi:hypothetical protein